MKQEGGKEDLLYSNTPYDDAFRTMEGKCDDLLIPLVNYLFHENYELGDAITRLRNEHFIEREGEPGQKRISDSHFLIRKGDTEKRYHMECESSEYDGMILVRIFEYTSQIALDAKERAHEKLYVKFPVTGLLLLRSKETDPEEGEIIISTPGGELSYKVPILRMKDIEIDEIFAKQLYFLIPFYIFNFEKRFRELEEDENKLAGLEDLYRGISERLREEAGKERKLSAFSFGVIIKLMQRVAYNLTRGHDAIQKKVGDIMGGEILELDWIKAYEEAEARTEVKVREEEKNANISIFIMDKREDGIPDEVIKGKLMKYYGMSGEEAEGYLSGKNQKAMA